MVTDQNANIIARHDYAPFGQEIPAGVSGRTSLWGASDFVNAKFTGYERDTETALDFAQARYMSAGLGRFMSPDPGNAGAIPTNPQSWNGYAYVLGNPLGLVDPSGKGAIITKLGPPSYLGSSSAPCTMDGVVTPCGLVSATSSVQCPNGNCSGLSADPNGNVFLNTYSPTPTLNCVGESVENFQCSWARWSAWLVQNWAETKYFGNVQQLLNGNAQTWGDTAGVGNALGVGTAAAVATPYVMAVGGMSTVDFAVGAGSPFHVAFGVDGTWLHATGEGFFNMEITKEGAAAYVRGFSSFQFSLPVPYPGAVLGTAGTAASTCVTGACYAYLKGWGF